VTRTSAKLDKSIPSSPRNIEGAVRRVVGFLEQNSDCRELANIQAALREALSNAMLHGNLGDPVKSVGLTVEIEEGGGITIVVRDSGAGFDPAGLPDPTEGDNIYRDSGRGVYMIQRLMDQVEYNFKDGTILTMRRNPPKS
jgi:anti-sigma regulatory factor (Ser/Thr protein kinase)